MFSMLTIAPLDQHGASYYEGTVAESREDYYSGKGEAEGQWFGKGAEALGLTSTVEKGQAEQLLAFRDPADPSRTLGNPPTREKGVGGYDLTHSAPKTVRIMVM